ncbi:MAG: HAMP domain-containing histidine kinase [Ruminococcus sp.]|nr:HAMP domain-containing histidine kinase [Ruminococcus sp.]
MKNSKKFILFFLILIVLFTAASAVTTAVTLNCLRNSTNRTVTQLLANIKSKYPKLNDIELAEILNSKTDTAETEQIMKLYGINGKNWIVYENERLYTNSIVAYSAVCTLAGCAFLAVFLIYIRREKRENICLTNYLTQINHGKYDLNIKENTEDDNSVLKNEIYKTTVMLREQSENSRKSKENLKNSLSDISHQLKTPLTSIMIMVDNLLDDPNMPDCIRQEFLSDIKQSSNNISFLVQSLLTLSKLDADSIVLKNNPENLSDIFDDCVQNTSILAEIKGVDVITDCSSIELGCDRKWLVEAITNILKNCIEHSTDGDTVTLHAEQNKLYTKITVTDTGCGIAPEDLPHIFERFYKGKNSDENSIGIGLALAKTIIEKCNGYISVDSKPKKGSCFTIRFFNRQ